MPSPPCEELAQDDKGRGLKMGGEGVILFPRHVLEYGVRRSDKFLSLSIRSETDRKGAAQLEGQTSNADCKFQTSATSGLYEVDPGDVPARLLYILQSRIQKYQILCLYILLDNRDKWHFCHIYAHWIACIEPMNNAHTPSFDSQIVRIDRRQ